VCKFGELNDSIVINERAGSVLERLKVHLISREIIEEKEI